MTRKYENPITGKRLSKKATVQLNRGNLFAEKMKGFVKTCTWKAIQDLNIVELGKKKQVFVALLSGNYNYNICPIAPIHIL